MSADYFTGEYGDPLEVTMPFDATGATVTIEARVDAGAIVNWTGGVTITPTSISRNVVQGELDAAGQYRCVAIATYAGPARVRKARFHFTVADPHAQ